MKIKSITILPNTKGCLAVAEDDLFVPEYIVLAVVENKGAQGILPLAIADLCTLSDITDNPKNFALKFNGLTLQNTAVTSNLISSISLGIAAAYIIKETSYFMKSVEEAQSDLIRMARSAGVKYDKRIEEVRTIEYWEKVINH